MSSPNITDAKSLIAVKGFEVSPVKFKNTGGAVVTVSVDPALPLGLILSVENNTVVLRGTPTSVVVRAIYKVTASNADGTSQASIEIAVVEAATKTQREAIIHVNDKRHDLDTPRSQVENAQQDGVMMQSHIKPHEKFAHQPMGDDKRLAQQTNNNPEAESRAQNTPELTPSPSAKLQAQAVLAAKPPSPTPTPGK